MGILNSVSARLSLASFEKENLVSQLTGSVKSMKKIEAAKFNDDMEYQKRLKEVKRRCQLTSTKSTGCKDFQHPAGVVTGLT